MLPSREDDPALVANFRFAPGAFDSFKRNTEARFSLKYPARVSLVILRRTGGGSEVVKTLCANLDASKGTQAHAWLGDTDKGAFAKSGDYIGLLTVGERRVEAEVKVYHE
jgi:hypothetical protein